MTLSQMIRVGVFGAGGTHGHHGVPGGRSTIPSSSSSPRSTRTRRASISVSWASRHRASTSRRTADALLDAGAEVAVDFTVLDAAREQPRVVCRPRRARGRRHERLRADEIDAFARALRRVADANAVIAPNFAIGAVLMMRFAEMAAPYFDSAEIIELHHDGKVDAPSGTAINTAERMAAASSDWAPDPTTKRWSTARAAASGAAGIPIHSVRLRGLVAHQEVLLGKAGQSLTIRHDSYDRTSCHARRAARGPGVRERPGLTFGLDALLGF